MVMKVKSRYSDTSYKFGIRLPHSVDEAIKLDKENKNTKWQDAIAKEMVHVRPALKSFIGSVQEANSKLVGYQQIRCNMVFDIKLDFTRKARYVAGGHTTSAPTSMTYSSVVARDSVRLVNRLPNESPECVLDRWSDIILRDFHARNPEIKQATGEMRQMAEVLNQQTQLLIKLKTEVRDLRHVSEENDQFTALQQQRITHLYNSHAKLEQQLHHTNGKLELLKTLPNDTA